MAANRSTVWLVLSAAAIALGLPYWLQPYAGLTLPGALLHPGLAPVVLAAAWLRARRIASWARCTLITAAVVPAVVAIRILGDGLIDPTRHNLWPFEILIALLIGFPLAAAGATIGSLFTPRPGSRSDDRTGGN